MRLQKVFLPMLEDPDKAPKAEALIGRGEHEADILSKAIKTCSLSSDVPRDHPCIT